MFSSDCSGPCNECVTYWGEYLCSAGSNDDYFDKITYKKARKIVKEKELSPNAQEMLIAKYPKLKKLIDEKQQHQSRINQ